MVAFEVLTCSSKFLFSWTSVQAGGQAFYFVFEFPHFQQSFLLDGLYLSMWVSMSWRSYRVRSFCSTVNSFSAILLQIMNRVGIDLR